MLVIKVGKDEKIDRALKRFKKKFRNTKILQQLRDKKHHTKKSTEKRVAKQKSIYNKIKKESYDE
jgi:small subunit ribosomal protein S21